MSAGDAERLEAVGEVIREAQVVGRVEYKRRIGYYGRMSLARAILTSDWLAAHDAEVSAAARREGAAEGVLGEVAAERVRQDEKWGEQNHPNGTGDDWALCSGQGVGWAEDAADDARRRCQEAPTKPWGDTYALILNEEVAEAFAESDPERLRAELIQVAAVAVAWVEKIDRDTARADRVAAAPHEEQP